MGKITTFVKLLGIHGKKVRAFGENKLLNWMPDATYLRLVYKSETGKKLNLENPKTFSEKLQWLKLNDRKEIYQTYVDKYEVRRYIAKTIGKKYLVPLIGVYNSVKEIPFDTLPNQFILKCTHGSGSNILCTDKRRLDIALAKRKLNRWMKKNWFWFGREWPYRDITPRIICERFIGKNGIPPHDFKVMCFNGKPKLIEIHIDRYENHVLDTYDVNWKKKSFKWEYDQTDKHYERPECLEKMLELSEFLAKDTYHARIDWYYVDGKLYFGEITLFPASGFQRTANIKGNALLGSWIKLPTETGDLK